MENLVIPVIVKADWRVERLRKMAETGELSAEDQARLARLEQITGGDASEADAQSIALASATAAVAGATDADAAFGDDPDYGVVPIEHFGLAILRGCGGWREGDAIGKTNRGIVEVRVPKLRPKGLGLGAVPANKSASTNGVSKKEASSSNNADMDSLKRGSLLQLTGGPHRDSYGKLEGFDEDNARLIVRLAIGGGAVTVSQFAVRLVPLDEYKRKATCINQTQYEQAKQQRELLDAGGRDRNGQSEAPRRQRSRRAEDEGREAGDRKRRRRDEKEDPRRGRGMWVRPELIVRVINQTVMGGRLYKEKMLVCDASSADRCSLRDAEGRVYHDMNESWLETVVPKECGAAVMLVGGQWRGRTGRLVMRDRQKGAVLVRLEEEDGQEVMATFDELCAWSGGGDDEGGRFV